MKAHDVARSCDERRITLRRPALLLCAMALAAACTGENLFTGPSLGGGGVLGPEVEITQPADDAEVTVGDSIRVTATLVSQNGVNEMTFSGTFETGTTAYAQETVSLSGAMDTTVTNFLQSAGSTTGVALIIVRATDVLGSAGADTVTVTVGN